MAGSRRTKAAAVTTAEYRHRGAKRKNVPPAAMAAEGTTPKVPKVRYEYSPHLPPVLRFDATGKADRLPELVAEAGRRALTPAEQKTLAEALRRHEPWLEWAGKRESDSEANGRGYLEVDPVALHIHERVSAQAVLKVAARQDVERDLFADPGQGYKDAVQFYQHDVDWANRLILGDSLQVMSSLAEREGLAGKVQMIYIDPPYGIRFGSNFQPEVGRRDVKDKEDDLTREAETVKAYRDTWNLGVHSYLSYLRERLIAGRELLVDTGSLFVQISDENLHRVRIVMDEVFGPENFCGLIIYQKTGGFSPTLIARNADFILWYAREINNVKYRQLYEDRVLTRDDTVFFDSVESQSGERRILESDEREKPSSIRPNLKIFARNPLTSDGFIETLSGPFHFEDGVFTPSSNSHWKTTQAGLMRLGSASRLVLKGNVVRFVRYLEDMPVKARTSMWTDTGTGGFVGDTKRYVVQTDTRAIGRCVLMTTDPGDLVLDPTCGSGTTGFVAEQWGRRWITIDTSRVAVSVARQRLLTARYDYYELRGEDAGPSGGFKYRTVPHITLKSIAQNTNLDPIFAKHEQVLDERLAAANKALARVSDAARTRLLSKMVEKERAEGKRAATDADRRRWELPKGGGKWEHWEVPFDTDPDWPKELQEAVAAYRKAWRAKMDDVNACIAANAEQEELVDQPEVVKGVVRVSGPFTVEAVRPAEASLVEAGDGSGPSATEEIQNVAAYLRQMYGLMKGDGVRLLGNREMKFSRLDPLFENGGVDAFHAEGRWVVKGTEDADSEGAATVGVVFGPQYGPVTAQMVGELIRPAARRFEDLVIAGFSFDGPAQEVIRAAAHPKLRIHMAHIRPDVNPGMAGLLKEQPGSQLFTVFGSPRVGARRTKGGEWVVSMEGIDVYDPVKNAVIPTKADKVAAWFLDGDYDGRTFCITQAFFPDKDAWGKLARALKGVLDEDRFAALSGTESLPFPSGKHKRAAVKAIDPRGNEVMATLSLEG